LSDPILAQDPASITPEDELVFLYPSPLALARSRAEAERALQADSKDYASMCRSWGALGGLTTSFRYGRRYYQLLAKVRWGDSSSLIELAAHMERRRS
jgi:hypothetical protein